MGQAMKAQKAKRKGGRAKIARQVLPVQVSRPRKNKPVEQVSSARGGPFEKVDLVAWDEV